MFKNQIGLKILVVLCFFAIIAGCSKKNNDEVESLKKQLTETQDELIHWQNRYDAMSIDLKNARSNQRNLGTQLDSVGNVSQSIEEQLKIYEQQFNNLQVEIQRLNTIITEQEAIIDNQDTIITEQENALREFLGEVTNENPYYYSY